MSADEEAGTVTSEESQNVYRNESSCSEELGQQDVKNTELRSSSADASEDDHDPEAGDKSVQPIIVVQPPKLFDRSRYQSFPAEKTVADVIEQLQNSDGQPRYRISFEDGRKEEVSTCLVRHVFQGSIHTLSAI